MFDSLYSSGTTFPLIFLAMGISLLCGLLSAAIFSLKLRSSKGFFITVSLLPALVTATFSALNVLIKTDTTTAITTVSAVMVGLGLIRFRSAQGKAEEMLALFASVGIGAICGLGYLAFAAILAAAVPAIYFILASLPLFNNARLSKEKVLKITIPEDLEYGSAFGDVFGKYLKTHEQTGIKTTGMGSMFRLTYRIVLKDPSEEKNFIDELRTKNGNLEISVMPYADDPREL